MDILHGAGQAFGLLAVVFGFVAFQMRTQKKLLFFQGATIVAFCLHYYLIGAATGLVLNILGVVRNVVYSRSDRKLLSGRACPVFFTVVMIIGGLLAWQGAASAFSILGVAIHTYCLSFSDPQKIRRSVLVSSSLLLVYNFCVFSVGGFIYEAVAILSSVIGLIRYRDGGAR